MRLIVWAGVAATLIIGVTLIVLGQPREPAEPNAYMVLGGFAMAATSLMLGAWATLGVRGTNWIASAIMLGVGLALAIPGAGLIALGGSWYYLLAGFAIVIAGVLLAMRNRWGPRLYAVFLLATIAWALGESGFDLLALLPRLATFVLAGLWFLTPWHAAAMRKNIELPDNRSGGVWVGGAVALAAACLMVASLQGYKVEEGTQTATPAGPPQIIDWRHYGNSPGGTRFAELTQIDTSNVDRLQEAWRFRTRVPFDFKGTPLQVGASLFVCTAGSIVIAIDPATGKEQWRYDPQTRVPGARNGDLGAASTFARTCRSIGYWEAPAGFEGECPSRILIGTTDGRLTAIDASSGRLCRSFGREGNVNLLSGLGRSPTGVWMNTSGPLIAGNVAVVGGFVSDSQELGHPSGVIRAYDIQTGAFVWAWDMGKPDHQGLPDEGGEYTRGTPNVWSLMSYDPQLNLVYAPTGNAAPDYFGGKRREFDEKYSAATVAIDAATGKLRWAYQNTHHDIWDYDTPSQPVLVDITRDGQRIPALAQPTKRGEIFLLDRRNGQPIWPATECPYGGTPTADGECPTPQGGVEGDWVSATQPVSGLPSFRPDRWEQDMWGLTPFDQLQCRIEYKKMRYEGHLTPPMPGGGGGREPTFGGTFQFPGNAGGFNWASVSVDADNGLLVAQPMLMGNRVYMSSENERAERAARTRAATQASSAPAPAVPPSASPPQETATPSDAYAPPPPPASSRRNTAYTAQGAWDPDTRRYGASAPFMSTWTIPGTKIASDIPCFEPPFGQLAVIDLNTGKLMWSRAIGQPTEMGPFGMGLPLPVDVGTPIYGGTLTTRGGLIFQVGTMDSTIRAVDIRTGRALWSARMPSTANATPITYLKDGRQYVVITVPNPGFAYPSDYPNDGNAQPTDDQGGYVIAYALPAGEQQ